LPRTGKEARQRFRERNILLQLFIFGTKKAIFSWAAVNACIFRDFFGLNNALPHLSR